MPDIGFIKFLTDIGAWAAALGALGYIWIHARDDRVVHARVGEIDRRVGEALDLWSDQKIANRLSAQADQAILQELARVGQRLEAVSTRVDSLATTTVELKVDVRNLSNYRRGNERT